MPAYWSQQPNGKFCRFSTVVDTLTDWNRDLEQAVNMYNGYLPGYRDYPQKLLDLRKENFITHLKPFSRIKEDFCPGNNSIAEFQEMLKEMGDTEGLSDEQLRDYQKIEEDIEEDIE